MQIIYGIIVIVLLVVGYIFVNDTKKKYKVCCGKGCRGCKVYDDNRGKKG